jgi:hypothetical protein
MYTLSVGVWEGEIWSAVDCWPVYIWKIDVDGTATVILLNDEGSWPRARPLKSRPSIKMKTAFILRNHFKVGTGRIVGDPETAMDKIVCVVEGPFVRDYVELVTKKTGVV